MPTHLQAKHTPAPTAAPAATQFSARGFEEETEQVEEQAPETKAFTGGNDAPAPPSGPTPPPDGGSVPPPGDGAPSSNFNFLDMPLRAEESGVQAKLTMGQPGDKYEREADQTAAQVMRMSDPQVDDPLEAEAGAPAVQQQCSTCEAEQPKKPSIQRKERGKAEPTATLQSRLNQQTGKGSPLPDGVRSHLEPRFGNDFSGVRVHTDSAAVQMNRELGAQAFTHGNDIYFNRGKYNPGSSSGQELLAHELTHTVQQTGGVQFKPEESQAQAETPEIQQKTKGSHFLWRMVQTKMGMLSPKEETGSPEVQAKCSQCEGEDTIQKQPISSMDSGNETVQAYSWDDFQGDARTAVGAVGSGFQAGAEFVGEGIGNLANFGVDSLAALVEKFSPELADLIRQGPLELLKETVGEGIKDWFNGLLEELGIADIVEDFRGSFDTLFETVRLVMEGDPETCDAVAEKLNSMTEFVSGVMDNPKVKALQDAFTQAGETFQEILDVFVAPVFNTIMDVVGDALSGIVDFGRQIWEWGAPVRNALKAAWDWVLEQLGIGGDGDSEAGLINWIKDKASEAWESVKETLGPVIEPIRNVVMVAAALSPITWIAAAVKYAPQVIEMVQWLWTNRDNPNIVESAHEEMGHTILPQLLSGLQGFGDGLENVVNSIIEEVSKISDGLISLISSLTGLPLLSMIKGTMETISTGIKDFITWSRETFQSISKSAVEFAKKIQEKIRPWIEVLTSLGAAILNPAMIPNILLGWAWRKLPDCYKGPIIDFLLDTLIEILSGMPDFPFFGVLWPFLKEGVLGFLRGLRAQATDVKVAISNKIAKIISGSSPAFALGFVKGFIRGIWEGLTDPFMLIYEAVTGINDVKDWLNRSDTEGGSQTGTQPDSTASQPSGTAQQPGATTQNTESRGGRDGSGALQEAGVNTLAIVIDRLLSMASELEAPSNEVTTNFLSAVTEVFSGAGEDITFEDVMDMMGDVQGQVMTAIGEAGGQIANQVCEFMMQDEAEAKIGDGAGWLAGTIVLELVLAYFTAGASIVAKGAIKAGRMITQVLDRSGPMMRMAADGMKTMGRHLDEILGSVRKLLSKAGDKASKVMDSLGFIGTLLRQYGDELLTLLLGGVPVPGGRPRRGPGDGPDAEGGVSGRPESRDREDGSPEPGGTPKGRTQDDNSAPPRPPEPIRPGHPRDHTPEGDQTTPDSLNRPSDRDDQRPTDDNTPNSPAYHQGLIRQAIRELEQGEPKDYDTVRKETKRKARQVERKYTRRLRRGIRLSVHFQDPASDKKDSDLDFRVIVAPNNSDNEGAKPFANFKKAKEELSRIVKSSKTTKEVMDQFEDIRKDCNLEEIEWKNLGTTSVLIHLKSGPNNRNYRDLDAFEGLALKVRKDEQNKIGINHDVTSKSRTIKIPDGTAKVGHTMKATLDPNKTSHIGHSTDKLDPVMEHLPTSIKSKANIESKRRRGELNEAQLEALGDSYRLHEKTLSDFQNSKKKLEDESKTAPAERKLEIENELKFLKQEKLKIESEIDKIFSNIQKDLLREVLDPNKEYKSPYSGTFNFEDIPVIISRSKRNEQNTFRKEMQYIAGHLLNNRLGGKDDVNNLYPITDSANGKHEREVESKVKNWVKKEKLFAQYSVYVPKEKEKICMNENKNRNEDNPSKGSMIVNAVFLCNAFVFSAVGKKVANKNMQINNKEIDSQFGYNFEANQAEDLLNNPEYIPPEQEGQVGRYVPRNNNLT